MKFTHSHVPGIVQALMVRLKGSTGYCQEKKEGFANIAGFGKQQMEHLLFVNNPRSLGISSVANTVFFLGVFSRFFFGSAHTFRAGNSKKKRIL